MKKRPSKISHAVSGVAVKCFKRYFFISVTFFALLTFFLIFQAFFYFKKNVGKVQSGKQVNKKHFQNNSQ